MKKQISPLHLFLGLCTVVCCSNTSLAIDLDETTRTIPLDSSGSTVILTPDLNFYIIGPYLQMGRVGLGG